MALAAAALLGYQLVENFDFPYFSPNLTTFWRRWHMSLSTWLRDYLYVPLGGNRRGRWLTYRNLMLTMLLGGLWHGAAWHFVVWGGLHGAALWLERALGVRAVVGPGAAANGGRAGRARRILGILATFYFTCIAWIFFRAGDLGDALVAARAFILFDSPGQSGFPPGLFVVFGLLAAVHLGFRWLGRREWWRPVPRLGFALLYGVLFALAVTFVPLEGRPFIYFQF
jgi:D-alanyl-lipoteichoic acid acyltransferase DltB (MBOAT superfamily)